MKISDTTLILDSGTIVSPNAGTIFQTATATNDRIIIAPFVGGAASFSGTLTTADLTANRTFTFPDSSGTLAIVGVSAGITQLTGDVTAGPGSGSQAATIPNDTVTFAKFQNITTARLLGRATAGSGDMEEITLGTNLSFTGTTLNAASASGTVTSVASANADITVATPTTTPVLTLVQAPALRSATTTVNVAAATAPTVGQVLTATSGVAATWQTPASPGTGTVTSVSVVSANGLAGTVATATTTPAITLSTNQTGILSGNGTAISGITTSAGIAAQISDETGTGALVFATSPTLVTPALGTPSALVGTNITGTAAGLTAGTVTTNANLTGAVTSVGNATSLGSFTSAQLATALTDETGTGANVFATSPTLVTPALGTPSSATLTNATGLPIVAGTTGTLTVARGGTGSAAYSSGSVIFSNGTILTEDNNNFTWSDGSDVLNLSNSGSGGDTIGLILNSTGAASVSSSRTIQFRANRTTGGITDIGRITAQITDIGNATAASKLIFRTLPSGGGSTTDKMIIYPEGQVEISSASLGTAPLGQLLVTQQTLGSAVLQLTSTATNDDPTELVTQGRVATTNNTTTTIQTIAIPATTTMRIKSVIIGRRTGGASGTAEDSASYELSATYKNVAGTATLVGAITKIADENQAAWDGTFTLSAGNVLVQVSGANNNNVTWHVTTHSWQVST